jgi:hypothetical protein
LDNPDRRMITAATTDHHEAPDAGGERYKYAASTTTMA